MKSVIYIVSFLALVSCVSSKPAPEKVLSVMTYNVENLFDAKHDSGKNDHTYLPLNKKTSRAHKKNCSKVEKKHWRQSCLNLDWNETLIAKKMQRLADVILQVNDGRGADIVILQEVENKGIVEQLRKKHLASAGYQETILIEGPDRRGIDVSILSKLPSIGKAKLHNYYKNSQTKKDQWPTRGLLQADFQLPNGDTLQVIGVHFPSQGAPTSARRIGVDHLLKHIGNQSDSRYVIVAGDFNITSGEEEKQGYFSKMLSPKWLVSHQIGCSNCLGTHKYRDHWSFLDVMLFSKKFGKGAWKVEPKSIRVAKSSAYQLRDDGSPARFSEGRYATGVSDHLPLVAELHFTPQK